MYFFISIIVSIIVPLLVIRRRIVKEKNIKQFILKNKYIIIIYVSLVVGFLTRLLFIADFPNALNVDEASAGYDAFSILNFGIDRNGNFLPVYLEAWGSGQSAAYAYLTIPFVKILGLNILSIRLPMAILGCISIIVMYKILEKITDKKTTIIGLIFFVINPWHIMKSRWGMDCNIFPDIILYSVLFLIRFLQTKKTKNLKLASVFIAFSAYTYATSYFFLPFFVIGLGIYLLKTKEITIKQLIYQVIIMLVISLPMIFYVIVNTFHLNTIKLFITIPALYENRFENISSLFGENFLNQSLTYFYNAILILIKQNDNLPWNDLPIYGITYVVSLPFALIGIYYNFKTKNKEKWIFNIWFIASVLLLFVVEPNINRINIIIIPIIYYTIIGITKIFEKISLTKIFIPIIYIGLFLSFSVEYFTTDWNDFFTFNSNIENVSKYIDTIDTEKIFFEYSFKEPFIYICFYNQINTKDFVDTIKYKDDVKGFDSVESFGKYYFYIPKKIDENAAYVFKRKNEDKYNLKDEKWEKKYIDDFVVCISKEVLPINQ